jgi:predicted transposase YdaD
MSERQPHDWLFKEIFSVPEHAASHLRSVLPAELVARVDWNTLSLESSRLQISGLDAKRPTYC